MITQALLLLIQSNISRMFQILDKRPLGSNMLHHGKLHCLPMADCFLNDANTKNQILQQLDSRIKNEFFYFTIDAQNNCITHCRGLNNCLGYVDGRFSARDYWHLMHPAHAVVDGFYASALTNCMTKRRIAPHDVQRLTHVSLVALLHKNGEYIYCKKESRALKISNDYKILEYTNEFTIIKHFNNEPYIFRMYDNDGQRADVEQSIQQLVKIDFEKKGGFSVQELRILKRYASSENATSEIIANSFKIEKSTISTYNKRILNKAENMFEHRFKNAQKVATYLKEIGLI